VGILRRRGGGRGSGSRSGGWGGRGSGGGSEDGSEGWRRSGSGSGGTALA